MAISVVLGSIVVSIPACHAGDRGSIPRRGVWTAIFFFFLLFLQRLYVLYQDSDAYCCV